MGQIAYAQETGDATRPFFGFNLGRINQALGNLKWFLSAPFISEVEKNAQEVKVKKEALRSVVDYLLKEIEFSRAQVENLAIEQRQKDELLKHLAENKFWFDSMMDGINDSRAVSQLRTIAEDLKQYRASHHTILIRKVNVLVLFNQQQGLTELARTRLARIAGDLDVLDQRGIEISRLRDLLNEANSKIDKSADLLEKSGRVIATISDPYEEQKYAEKISLVQYYLGESNVALRETYRIFVEMVKEVDMIK